MIAEIEQPDGSFVEKETGEPECGEDFCGVCGDCISCYKDQRCEKGCRWIIYLDDKQNPNYIENKT